MFSAPILKPSGRLGSPHRNGPPFGGFPPKGISGPKTTTTGRPWGSLPVAGVIGFSTNRKTEENHQKPPKTIKRLEGRSASWISIAKAHPRLKSLGSSARTPAGYRNFQKLILFDGSPPQITLPEPIQFEEAHR